MNGPAAAAPATEAVVRAALGTIMDPELPMISIVDLGMVGSVQAGPAFVRVELLPTYVGCPAIAIIERAVEDRLVGVAPMVDVVRSFATPWSTDRISAAGIKALRAAGVATPTGPAAIQCPWCDSDRVEMDNLFGPTQCRSLFFCRACRQPFEAIKLV